MIRFEGVTITYPDAAAPALRDVDLTVDEGELCLVVGRTGVGKSTLLGAINGLVPHFTGGHLRGRVVVDGRDTSTN
ncbi:MAG: ATP-binding cassette domain-containing protein, partial [Microthrixaceae bacterium]